MIGFLPVFSVVCSKTLINRMPEREALILLPFVAAKRSTSLRFTKVPWKAASYATGTRLTCFPLMTAPISSFSLILFSDDSGPDPWLPLA